jgi:anti-sigma B factor antagonist
VGANQRWSVSVVDGHVAVTLQGEFDIVGADELRSALVQAWEHHRCPVVVDLDAVTFLDSQALNALLVAHRLITKDGGGLKVQRASTIVRRVLEVTGSARLLGLEPGSDRSATGTEAEAPAPPS